MKTSRLSRSQLKQLDDALRSGRCNITQTARRLSTNQMTHFYSRKKNTDEMIKLIDLLCLRYHDQQKLYLSWAAAI